MTTTEIICIAVFVLIIDWILFFMHEHRIDKLQEQIDELKKEKEMNWAGKSESQFPNDKIEEYKLRKKLDGGRQFVKNGEMDEEYQVKVTDHSIQVRKH